jgi:carboxymethylenebutenolidase
MDQRVIDLYDSYTHGALGRREFLDGLARLAGGMAAALSLLGVLQNDYAAAAVPEDDARLATETARYDAGGATMSGALVRLEARTKRAAVVVIHENRGLNPHIRDVARRLALEGYLALAVDALAPLGGTPADEEQAREKIGALDRDETLRRIAAAVPFLRGHAESTGTVTAVGFCWGGAMVNRLAAAGVGLTAGVSYYGMPPPAEEIPRIEAPLLLHYAGKDDRINAAVPAFREALDRYGKRYELHVYEGAQHAFNNDTNKARYDAEAAALAWGRTLAFLRRHTSTPAQDDRSGP